MAGSQPRTLRGIGFRGRSDMSEPHLFPKRVLSAFQRTTDIFNQRGTEYGDTWKLCTWLKFRAVAKELGCMIPEDACRALVAAGLADLKYFRFGGGYKEDNFDDGINYDGFTVEEVRHVKVERQLAYRKAESAAQIVERAPKSVAIARAAELAALTGDPLSVPAGPHAITCECQTCMSDAEA